MGLRDLSGKLQPFLQKSSVFSFGAVDSRTLSHLVFWEQKENKRPECMVLKMLPASHSFLLSNHRHAKQTMNLVSIQGSSFYWGIMWLMKVGFSLALVWEAPWCWILIGVRAGGAEKWLISQDACVLWSLEQTTSFRCWGFVWIRSHMWAHVLWFWSSLCVLCVSSEVSLLHSASQLWAF